MKKFLVILMVVAMASFLFVGCIPGVTTVTDVTTVTPTTPVTKAPVITAVGGVNMTSTAQQYVNRAESATAAGIVVMGTAPTYSEVKVYLNGIVAGTSDTTWAGVWSVTVTLTELGADGAKVLDADAIEPGCEVSVKSNAVSFILDRTLPTMTSVAAHVGTAPTHYKIGFSEDVNISVDVVANPASALNPLNWSVAMGAGANTILAAADTFTAVSTIVIKIDAVTVPVLAAGTSYALYCWAIQDTAGNPIAATVVPPVVSTSVIYGLTLP